MTAATFLSSHGFADEVAFSRLSLSEQCANAFRAWFGDSKVVNAQGQPLVVYHGTASDFSVFDDSMGRGGFYFTDDLKAAQEYANYAFGEGPRVIAAYLAIRNPLVLDKSWFLENAAAEGETDWGAIDTAVFAAAAKGHDGVILRNCPDYDGIVDGVRVERDYDQFIAFRPEQIKSASLNSGFFDPSNPDIYA